MIWIEGVALGFDEIHLGVSMYYGEDPEYGIFHCISIGFLLFSIDILRTI